MKELKDYTVRELKDAIYAKQEAEAIKNSETLPKDYYSYQKIDAIDNIDIEDVHKTYYYCHIENGSEGYDYIVQANAGAFGGAMEEKIRNSVIHNHITEAVNGGWDSYFEDVSVEELGRYGMSFIKVAVNDEPEEE